MLLFSVLSSGSKANATYVSDGKTHLLIDCGLSAREASRRLSGIGVDPSAIDAVLITHEHSDHISGIPVFARKHGVTVFGNQKTLSAASYDQPHTPFSTVEFEVGKVFAVGSILVEAFSVPHDASDPVGFRLSSGEFTLGVVTDLGYVTNTVRSYLRMTDALVLESNHDPELLVEAPYPWELKQRIRGKKGHLSNQDASAFIEELSSDPECRIKVLIAAHVSEKANYFELALEGFKGAWRQSDIIPSFVVADVYKPTQIFTIGADLPVEDSASANDLQAMSL